LIDAVQPDRHEPWFVLSLARGLSVIRAFSGAERGLRVSEVAQACGLSRAAARRFVLTLIELGYVTSREDRYFLRPTALDLGYAYLSSMQLDTVVQPELDDVSARTGESCSLAVLNGGQVLFVARAPARRMIKIHIGVGSRLPAQATSLGKVLLAHLAPARLDGVLAGIDFVRYTEDTIVDPAGLRRELEQVRDRGYSTVFGELEGDVASVAVPVFGAHGTVVAAVNASTYTSRLREEGAIAALLEHLRRAADRIGGALRASPHLGLNLQTDPEDAP
jgi:IclR family pca regulon transcriptional regulator